MALRAAAVRCYINPKTLGLHCAEIAPGVYFSQHLNFAGVIHSADKSVQYILPDIAVQKKDGFISVLSRVIKIDPQTGFGEVFAVDNRATDGREIPNSIRAAGPAAMYEYLQQ